MRDRALLEDLQRRRLRALFDEILPRNPFYARKLAGHDPADFASLPFTTKQELFADQAKHPPYGSVLTYPLHRYCRLHQTSGTSGQPLRWLDTGASWEWMLGCWDAIFDVVELRRDDRLFFAFSFGPFLGFWTAFEAAARQGMFCLPAGGMSSAARLRFLAENKATVVLCTPTYALHLAEVAREERIALASLPVRMLIVAGEPGGSISQTRARIESAWGARVFDHSGMTEIGPCAVECPANPAGLHLLPTEYIAEVVDPATGQAVPAGQVGELVLTNLGRWGSPLLRYRTGDLVCLDPTPCPCGRPWPRLAGGILGRADDMIHVRGNNVYPSAMEALLRRFPEVVEYRIEIDHTRPLTAVRIDLEPVPDSPPDLVERVDRAFRDEFFFRADVGAVPPGSLPRYEMKARRIQHKMR
jgi:phenylacetate-CoA ligase